MQGHKRSITRAMLAALALGSALALSAPAGAQQAAFGPPGATEADAEFNALFRETLKRPADVPLAFKLARRAVELGDYEAAIGVYERILFYDPHLVRVRLELGRLYYKLGSYETARSYFDAVKNSPALSDAERRNAEGYLTEIARRLETNQFSVYAQAGVRYQTNASYGPTSRIVIGDDVAALLPPNYAAKGDGNVFGLASIRHVYDFGNQRGDVWESVLNLYYSQQFQIERLDLGFAEFTTGPRLALAPDALPGWSVRGYGILGGVALGGSGYLGTYGAGISLYAPFGGGLGVEPFFELRERNYDNTYYYPTAGFQTGSMWTAGANVFGRINETMRWRVRLAYNDAEAELPWYAYTNWSVDAALPIEFEGLWGVKRWLVIPSAGFSRYDYNQANPVVSPFIPRTDDQYRVGLALDVPVYENWGLLTQVQYSWSDSTLPNYSFNNFSVSVGPNVRF